MTHRLAGTTQEAECDRCGEPFELWLEHDYDGGWTQSECDDCEHEEDALKVKVAESDLKEFAADHVTVTHVGTWADGAWSAYLSNGLIAQSGPNTVPPPKVGDRVEAYA